MDLIFTKAKVKGSRRLSFEQFITALLMCAEKKGLGLDEIVNMVLSTGAPEINAMKPTVVRLHDDKVRLGQFRPLPDALRMRTHPQWYSLSKTCHSGIIVYLVQCQAGAGLGPAYG